MTYVALLAGAVEPKVEVVDVEEVGPPRGATLDRGDVLVLQVLDRVQVPQHA